MADRHFSNTGQKLQLAVALLGAVFSGVNAYPAIKAFDFVAVWPIVFYLLVALFVLAAINLSGTRQNPFVPSKAEPRQPEPQKSEQYLDSVPSKPEPTPPHKPEQYLDTVTRMVQDRLPGSARRFKMLAATEQIKLKLGERWSYGEGTNTMRIVLQGIKEIMGENYADLTVYTLRGMYGGTRIKQNEDKQDRFFVPAAEGVLTRSSLFALSHSESVWCAPRLTGQVAGCAKH
jgi:hypothetical protein